MKKLLLLVTLFIFSGCSVNQLFLYDEIDKVHIVNYSSYVKERRAYFTREGLLPIRHGKKYLFLYHPKSRHLYVLLRKRRYFLLYDMSAANREPKKFTTSSTRKVLRKLRRYGYRTPKNITKLGYVVRTGLRRYKGVKTLMIDVKDYRTLKRRYEEAIRTYNPSKVSGIRTPLPKKMILSYFTSYYKKARTPQQKAALQKIARKLRLGIATKTNGTPQVQEEPQQTQPEKSEQPELIEPLFPYYLKQAPIDELEEYLDTTQSHSELTRGERSLLEHRLEKMKKEKLIAEAPLERLIEAYKRNQDPAFKKHILARIKELRAQQ